MGLIGKTTPEKIWNFLKSKGLSSCGAAGLMGNLYAESGLNPQNLQNSYEKKLGHTDASYNGIANPNVISVGQKIKIPGSGVRTYTVKSGDSLWAIAAKQLGDGSRYNEIKTMNGLTSNTIYAGQTLKLPA